MRQFVCAWCEQEFGVKVNNPEASHGICPRHAVAMTDQLETIMRRANIPQDVIDSRIVQYTNNTKQVKGEAPDMAEEGIPPNAVKV